MQHLVNCDLVTPVLNRLKGVHLLVDQQFGYVRLEAPLLDFAGSVGLLSFVWRPILSFVSLIRYGESLLCRAGFTLGSARHFLVFLVVALYFMAAYLDAY